MGADPGVWYPLVMVVMTCREARVCWYIYSFGVVMIQVTDIFGLQIMDIVNFIIVNIRHQKLPNADHPC